MALDEWADQSASEEQTKAHAQMMARALKFYIEEFEKIGLSRPEAYDAAVKMIVVTLQNPGK
jgi:hypothetical protein